MFINSTYSAIIYSWFKISRTSDNAKVHYISNVLKNIVYNAYVYGVMGMSGHYLKEFSFCKWFLFGRY